MVSISTDETSAVSSSSSSSTPLWKFDVFLSFKGEDTRTSFTDHLHDALVRKGILTFRDDEKLEKGKTIAPELQKAIKESRFSIVIISRHYACSRWCLDELLEIAECKKVNGQTVFPVFYQVEPSEVRKQTGAFGEAFARHERVFKDDVGKVKKWRETLTEIANVSGWDVKHRPESEVINEIVEKILSILNRTSSSVSKNLVGMDSRVEKMLSYLDLGRSNAVCTIGIWGMGGIGKTTLANEIFRKIKDQFDSSCFLSNVREKSEKKETGLVKLQKRLYNCLLGSDANIQNVNMGIDILRNRLCYNKVLIILDDVDKLEQIEALVGICDEQHDWFGPGSRIIVTTRNKHLLMNYGNSNVYEVDKLAEKEALYLFCRKAFKMDHPADGYKEKSDEVVKYANGLPLALDVLGSFLVGRNVDEWSSTLDRLKEHPDEDILGRLQVSFDGLKHTEKKTFLDIACFFKGEDKYRVKRVLGNCDYSPDIDIEVLIEKSLVTVVGDKLWMHDLLQELGWYIVRRDFPEEPGKHSRLWLQREILNVLQENKGTQGVEGIFLCFPRRKELHLNADPFLKMCRLRLLKICNVKFSGGVGYLSKELRLLEWRGYPLNSIPSSFQPDKLVELNLSNSCIEQLWKENRLAERLMCMNLSNCQYLTKTPNFNTTPNLERLILRGCKKLSEIHQSIGVLKRLVLLNLKGCESLKILLKGMSLESLKTLILSGCSKLNKFPEIVGKMEELTELYLDGTAIVELPVSIKRLNGLSLLNLEDCKNLLTLPDIICCLTALTTLNVSGCSRLDHLPENLGSLECLQELDANETAIRKIPSSLALLKNLKKLSFRGCNGTTYKSWLSCLDICLLPEEGSESICLQLPDSFSHWVFLKSLDLSKCSLQEGSIPDDLVHLRSLEHLDLSENNFRSIPDSICQLSELRELSLNGCSKLQSLPKLPLSAKRVNARNCAELETSNEYTIWTTPKGFCFIDCQKSNEGSKLQSLPKLPPSVKRVTAPYCAALESSNEYTIWTSPNGFCFIDCQKSNEGARYKEYKIPVSREHIYPLLHTFYEDDIYRGKGFRLASSQTTVPDWCNSSAGSSLTIQLPPDLGHNSTWMGFSLFVVYEVQNGGNTESTTFRSLSQDSTLFLCHFHTDEGRLPIFLGNFIETDCSGGSYRVCKYIPREWFAGHLDKASHVEASISINNPYVRVKMCGAHLIYEQNVEKFVRDLFPANNVQNLISHYQHIVEQVTNGIHVNELASILMEQRTIDMMESVEQEQKGTLRDPSDEQEQDITSPNRFLLHVEEQDSGIASSIAKQGCKSYSTMKLRSELQALLSRLFQGHYACNFNFGCIFPLKAILPWFKYQCLGRKAFCCLPSDLLDHKTWVGFALYVVFRSRGSFSLNNLDLEFCPSIVAHLQMHGSRVVHTAEFLLRKDSFVGSEHRLVIFHVPRVNFPLELNQCGQINVWFATSSNHLEIEIGGIRTVYEQDLKELIQTITECTMGSPDVYHQHYFRTFGDMEKKVFYEAEIPSEGDMAFDLGYFYSTFPREHEFLHQQVQENEQDITRHLFQKYYQGFDQKFVYNSCFPPSEIPDLFKRQNNDHSVEIQLTKERNWVGLALWAYFSDKEHSTAELDANDQDSDISHFLLCHLETNEGSVEPLHAYQTTNEEIKWLRRLGGFIWLSYIPRGSFSDQLFTSECGFIEASFASERRGLRAQRCGICLVYDEKGGQEFEQMILNCMNVFREDSHLIQETLVEKDSILVKSSSGQVISHQDTSIDLTLSSIFLNIAVETPVFESDSIAEWKTNFGNFFNEYFKVSLVVMLSLADHTISMLRSFDPYFSYNFCFPRKEVLEWFKHQTDTPNVIFPIPQNLYDDENWMGFVICAAFSVHEHPAAILDNLYSQIYVHLMCHFRLDESHCLFPAPIFGITKEKFKWLHLRGFIWLTYIPRQAFSDGLNALSYVEVEMRSFDCPGLVVERCGMRLLYRHDVEEFKQTIVKCVTSFFDDLDPICQFLKEKKDKKCLDYIGETSGTGNSDIGPQHQGKRNRKIELLVIDFDQNSIDQNSIYNSCFPPTEFLEWFMNHNEGPSVKIELPTSLLSDGNWVGLALCAYFVDLDPQNPRTSIDNLDIEEISHHLICHLQTERGSLDPHVHQTTNEEFRWLHHEGRFIWLSYIPRSWFSDQLDHCSGVEASFASDKGRLCVERCGLRLLFHHDVDEFKQTIAHCMNLSSENNDLGNERTYKQNYHDDDDTGTSTSSRRSTKVNPFREGSKGPNDANFKGKEKLVLE